MEALTGAIENNSVCPSLSWTQRLWGFVICFALGFVCSFIGTFFITINLALFAVLYTLGNVFSLASTGFLVGPIRQLKSMFDPTRMITTIVFLAAMALTLTAALWWQNVGLVILFVIIQWLALIWYSLSYIPYARTLVTNCAKGLV
eukprot:TRINITY_DN3538_c0_g2_i1.p3 TRINITY_DN3538_c0_g2~~TRINITY_DN3538_c0_g2_i1.p3  ORF type:complete len:146 (-),score=20.15 TRINITY_DN3538_c0_g2_i1:76-513(-)